MGKMGKEHCPIFGWYNIGEVCQIFGWYILVKSWSSYIGKSEYLVNGRRQRCGCTSGNSFYLGRSTALVTGIGGGANVLNRAAMVVDKVLSVHRRCNSRGYDWCFMYLIPKKADLSQA